MLDKVMGINNVKVRTFCFGKINFNFCMYIVPLSSKKDSIFVLESIPKILNETKVNKLC